MIRLVVVAPTPRAAAAPLLSLLQQPALVAPPQPPGPPSSFAGGRSFFVRPIYLRSADDGCKQLSTTTNTPPLPLAAAAGLVAGLLSCCGQFVSRLF